MVKDDYAYSHPLFCCTNFDPGISRLRVLFGCFILLVICAKAEATRFYVADYAEAAARCQAWVSALPSRRRCWYYARQVCGVRCLRGQLWNRYWKRWQDYHNWRFPSWGCAYNPPPDGSLYRANTGWIEGGHPYEVCPAPPPSVPDKQLGARCSKNKQGGSLVGNPCNAGSGNKTQTEIDLTGAGTGLQFLRYYNSGTNADVGLGRGWTSSLHSRLEIDVDALVVRAPDGRGEPWLKNNGVWRGDPDSRLLLAEDASGYELKLPTGETKRYDLGGRMTLQRSPDGRQTTYSYNVDGRLEQIMGPFGHGLEFGYDVDGHLVQLTDPGGSTYRYRYDNKSNLVAVIYPDSTPHDDLDNPRRSYLYENRKYPNLLTGIIDEEGHRYASFEYDDAGRAISTEHAVTSNGVAQERFLLTYDGPSQTTVTDPIGRRWVYQFADSLGSRILLSRTSLADGRASSQDFDANNNLVSRTDEEGRTTTYTYNANNQRISMTEASGTAEARTTIYEYVAHDIDLPTRVVTPSIVPGFDKEVLTQYDGALNVISITRTGYQPDGIPVSRAIAFQYNAHGQVIRIDGPRTDIADVTTLTYNECAIGGGCGQLASITNAFGQTTTYDNHDAYGRVKQATDPDGLVTTFEYDVRGRIAAVRQTPPAGQGAARVTTYTYDSLGQVSSVTTPDGMTLTYSYDAAHDLRAATDNLGNRVEYLYDPKGNRIKEDSRDSDGMLVRTVETAYDLRDHVAMVNQAGSVTQLVHDAVGNLSSRTDANLNPGTVHTYDGLDRLRQTVDALSNPTTFSYDLNDRLVEVRAPNSAATSYEYDDLGNLLREVSPDRGTITYTYDAAGNRETATDARGVTARYSYDALNRLVSIDYPGAGEDVAFIHDSSGSANTCSNGIGRLCLVSDSSGTTTYAYDSYGNIIRRFQVIQGVGYDTEFTYDAGDRMVSITYPGGRAVGYERNILGQIATVNASVDGITAPIVSTATYRADGLITGQLFGNGLAETRSYDQQGRLLGQKLGTAPVFSYVYDANGNLLQRELGITSANYGYDGVDRLISDSFSSASAFTYDANSNRLTETRGDGAVKSYAYAAGTNHLTVIDNIPRTHDAAGNMTGDGQGKTFTYNQAGRLFEVYDGGVLAATYTYNAMGQRIVKTDHNGPAPQTTIYHYDLAGHLIAESNETGGRKRAYIWRDDEPVAQVVATGGAEALLYLHTDHLRTPRQASDGNGTIIWRWDSDAFGSVLPNEDPDGDGHATTVNLRFPGQYYDAETGHHYNWHRYYDSKTGRYITSDPIGLEGGLNTYLYALGNPVILFDRKGLDTAGCDIGPFKRFETPCRLECCATHDQCYKNYNCTARSWWNPDSPCGQCNVRAVRCFLDCQDDPNRDDPNRPNYFCAKTGNFINIPSSEYPDVSTAECKCRD